MYNRINSILIKRFYSKFKTENIASVLKSVSYGEKFLVKGWMKSKRQHGRQTFLHIEDGSCFERLQVIVAEDVLPKENLTYHACLSVEGQLEKSLGKGQDVDLKADNIKLISPGAPIDYPYVERGDYSLATFRQFPQFRSRLRRFSSMLRIRSRVKASMRDYFNNENFICVDTPIITTNDCEGNGNAFCVKGQGIIKAHREDVSVGDGAFGVPVFLTVSGQLHLESVLSGLSRVYNCNPAFRVEGDSRMHLSEFWMVEAEEVLEKSSSENYSTLMNRIESLIKYSLKDALLKSPDDVQYQWRCNKKKYLSDIIEKAINEEFIRLSHREAMDILTDNRKKLKNDPPVKLNRESELFLTKFCGNIPVFITDWPINCKPFYMLTNEEGTTSYGLDLLVPGVGEIAGGGLREHRYQVLKDIVAERNLSEEMSWYVDLRKWGYSSSGGFGVGLERFLMFLLGIDHAADVIAFPRTEGKVLC